MRAVRRVGDTIWSPEFVVVAEPNEWEAANSAARRGLLSSLDEFYIRCADQASESWARMAESIVSDWISRDGGSEGHNSQSTVALYFQGQGMSRRTNVLQLSTGGALTVCRGYILETTGLQLTDAAIEELESAIRSALPGARRTDKAYYISADNPTADGYHHLADTITRLLSVDVA